MDGFTLMPMKQAAKVGDVFVTVTGDKHVISLEHVLSMKDGAIIANAGHFNVEIALAELEKISKSKREVRPFVTEYMLKDGSKRYILGEGRLINLAAAEGHPAEVMDMSFANQALAAEWFLANRGSLTPQVYRLPMEMDHEIARLKLKAMGVAFDTLTKEQSRYLSSWQEGT